MKTCSRGHTFTGSEPCPVCWPGYRTFTMRSKVWLYSGEAAWHFVTLPKKQAKDIRDRFAVMKRGWGSIPVTVTIGESSWKTSIFPDKKSGSYLLPLKTEVRKKEKIVVGKTIGFTVEVRL